MGRHQCSALFQLLTSRPACVGVAMVVLGLAASPAAAQFGGLGDAARRAADAAKREAAEAAKKKEAPPTATAPAPAPAAGTAPATTPAPAPTAAASAPPFEAYPEVPYPVRVTDLADVTAISAGAGHSLALRKDGTVLAWGENKLGQIGDGTLVNRDRPVVVPGVRNASQSPPPAASLSP